MIYREAGQFKTTYASDQAIFAIPQDRWFVVFAAVAAFVIPPLAANEYWLQAVLIPFLIYSLAAIGLNLLTGYAGQLSLGTGGFMAVGAYSAFKLTTALPQLNIVVVFLLSANRSVLGVIVTGPNATASVRYVTALALVVVGALVAKNLVRGRVGRSWMAIRDRDIAAEIIGVRPLRTKLLAFGISSFYCGVAGAELVFLYFGSAETLAFDITLSFLVLFMVIIGGLGSILGSFLGAAFIVLVPIFLTNAPQAMGLSLPVALQKQFELMVFGGLIIFFLIVEPHGLARLWQITKEKLRLWPFPH